MLADELLSGTAAAAPAAEAAGPTYAPLRDATRFWIQRVAVPCVTGVGLFGNLITIVIMTRRRMRSTTNMYLAALAFVDMLYLVLMFLLSLSHYPDIQAPRYKLYWQLRPFLLGLTDASSNTSVWLTVTFTIERFIAVKYPIKGKLWCTERRAKCQIGLVFLFGILFALPVPFEWRVVERPATRALRRPDAQLVVPAATAAAATVVAESMADLYPLTSGPLSAMAPALGDDDDDDDGPERQPDQDSKGAGDESARSSQRQQQQLGAEMELALENTEFGSNETYKSIYFTSTAVLFCIAPLVLLTLFNGFLIHSVHSSRRKRDLMTTGQQQQPQQHPPLHPPLHAQQARQPNSGKYQQQQQQQQRQQGRSRLLIMAQSSCGPASQDECKSATNNSGARRAQSWRAGRSLDGQHVARVSVAAAADFEPAPARNAPEAGAAVEAARGARAPAPRNSIINPSGGQLAAGGGGDSRAPSAPGARPAGVTFRRADSAASDAVAAEAGAARELRRAQSMSQPVIRARAAGGAPPLWAADAGLAGLCARRRVDFATCDIGARDTRPRASGSDGGGRRADEMSLLAALETSGARSTVVPPQAAAAVPNSGDDLERTSEGACARAERGLEGARPAGQCDRAPGRPGPGAARLDDTRDKTRAARPTENLQARAPAANGRAHMAASGRAAPRLHQLDLTLAVPSGAGSCAPMGAAKGAMSNGDGDGAKLSPASSEHAPAAAPAGPATSQERRITIMLIAVVILFLFCQLPSATMLIYTSVHQPELNTSENNLLLALNNIFNFLMAINAAGNFILYSFLSKTYRRTFVILFCGCLRRQFGRAGARSKQSGAAGTATITVSKSCSGHEFCASGAGRCGGPHSSQIGSQHQRLVSHQSTTTSGSSASNAPADKLAAAPPRPPRLARLWHSVRSVRRGAPACVSGSSSSSASSKRLSLRHPRPAALDNGGANNLL